MASFLGVFTSGALLWPRGVLRAAGIALALLLALLLAPAAWAVGLPRTYAPLAYVDNNLKQHVLENGSAYGSAILPDETLKLKAKFSTDVTANGVTMQALAGSTIPDHFGFEFAVNKSGSAYSVSATVGGTTYTTTYGTAGETAEVELSKDGLWLDGVKQAADFSSGLAAAAATQNLYVLAGATTEGSASRYFRGRIYWLQLYQGDTLVRDYVPCVEIATGDVGLYERVSGAFTKGGRTTEGVVFQAGPSAGYGDVTIGGQPGGDWATNYPVTAGAAYPTADPDAYGYGCAVSNAVDGATYSFSVPKTEMLSDYGRRHFKCAGWRLLKWDDGSEIASGAGSVCEFAYDSAWGHVADGGSGVYVEWVWSEESYGRYLPGGYEEVEYVESLASSKQWIDTLYVAGPNTRIVVELAWPTASNFGEFGYGASNSSYTFRFGRQSEASGGGFWAVFSDAYGSAAYSRDAADGSFGIVPDTDFHVFDLSATAFSVDGRSFGPSPTAITHTLAGSLFFFAQRLGWSGYCDFYATVRLRAFRIYESGELVKDFTPARNVATGKYGMYDVIGSKFHPNLGGGSFTGGSAYPAAPAPEAGVAAFDGGVAYQDGAYVVQIFTNASYSLTASATVDADVLIVGGGGGGGGTIGGGGGAGQVITQQVKFVKGVTYAMTIGAGGAFHTSYWNVGSTGGDTTLSGDDVSIVAKGGGGGGGWNDNAGGGANAGGSTQGKGSVSASVTGGHKGGAGISNGWSGGGGGAGEDGRQGKSPANYSGRGGNGIATEILGHLAYFGGGGGAGAGNDSTYAGDGGKGGGGFGGDSNRGGTQGSKAGFAATPSTGGGGGGGGYSGGPKSGGWNGANGGSGTIILRYCVTDIDVGASSESAKLPVSGGEKYGEFTESGDGYGYVVKATGGKSYTFTATEYWQSPGANHRRTCTGWTLTDKVTDELLASATEADDLSVRTNATFTFTAGQRVRLEWQWREEFLDKGAVLSATDGEILFFEEDNAISCWTNAGTYAFTPKYTVAAEMLLVGGGGGGAAAGGGGGGGGVVYTNLVLYAGTNYAFTVGAGGAAGVWGTNSGDSGRGGKTIFGGNGHSFVVYGGGAASSPQRDATWYAEEIASGGGAGMTFNWWWWSQGGLNSSQGKHGGTGWIEGSGGGGGVMQRGGDGTSVPDNNNGPVYAGKGGDGLTNSITGVARVYGSGGGGGVGRWTSRTNHRPGYGGADSGGQGGNCVSSLGHLTGNPGLDGMGGGGGGGGRTGDGAGDQRSGGKGGDGGVWIRYRVAAITIGGSPNRLGEISPQAAYDTFAVVTNGHLYAQQDSAEIGTTYTYSAPASWCNAAGNHYGMLKGWKLWEVGTDEPIASGTYDGTSDTMSASVTPARGKAYYLEWQWDEHVFATYAPEDENAFSFYDGNDLVQVFTNGAHAFTPVKSVAAEILLVGGGGGGGAAGGGGGGGGVLYLTNVVLYAGSNYTFTVGAGGAAGVWTASNTSSGDGGHGGKTLFGGGGASYEIYGGGAGARYQRNGPYNVETASGGGGGMTFNWWWWSAGGQNSSQGMHGGGGWMEGCGGGGGYSQSGGSGNSVPDNNNGPVYAGKGGDGFTNAITGVAHVYASGGGGGVGRWTNRTNHRPGAGGAESGGSGGWCVPYNGIVHGIAGSDGMGGGGGGGGRTGDGEADQRPGGKGGSGAVILRYRAGGLVVGGTPLKALAVTPAADVADFVLSDEDDYTYGEVLEPEVGKTYGFTVPDYWQSADGFHRVTCLGWKLYNLETGELIKQNDDSNKTSASFAYPGFAVYYLEWQWDDAFVKPQGTSAGAEVTFDEATGDVIEIIPAGAWEVTPWHGFAADVLLVAGGGGGGSGGGGGGGGGVMLTNVAFAAGQTYLFNVGLGGAGGTKAASGSKGGCTFISNCLDRTIYYEVEGGGAGGGVQQNGGQGANGGGAGMTFNWWWWSSGGAANAVGGKKGGGGWKEGCGGGGGMSGAGASGNVEDNNNNLQYSGKGGDGFTNSITGVARVYGSGGGGGSGRWGDRTNHRPGAGGADSGGYGGYCVNYQGFRYGVPGVDGMGGGGGGGARYGDDATTGHDPGGKGGDGAVILRYHVPAISVGGTPGALLSSTPAEPYAGWTAKNDGSTYGSIASATKGDAFTFTCSDFWRTHGGSRRITCMGWKLYDLGTGEIVDQFIRPDKYSNDFQNATNCTITYQGAPLLLEWQWDDHRFNPIGPVDATSDTLYLEDDDAIVQVYTDTNVVYSFTAPQNFEAELLLVGGGGSGGNGMGGGGGAGGFIYTNLTFKKGETYTFRVGGGGLARWSGYTARGSNGSSTWIACAGETVYKALGGQGGSAWDNPSSASAEGNGSGGGTANGRFGGWGTYGQGKPGGWNNSWKSGGGGGAGGNGQAGTGSKAGDGGAGLPCSITGEEIWYAGGGGGGCGDGNLYGTGGQGGGGRGAYGGGSDTSTWIGANGTDGLGGGGGGGEWNHNWRWGGNGGSGTFIIRYRVPALAVSGYPNKVLSVTADPALTEYVQTDDSAITYGRIDEIDPAKDCRFDVPSYWETPGKVHRVTALGWKLIDYETGTVLDQKTSSDADFTNATFKCDRRYPLVLEWQWDDHYMAPYVSSDQGSLKYLDDDLIHLYDSGAHAVQFNRSTWAQVLLVGGGGAGGSGMGGGGGGGGVIYTNIFFQSGCNYSFSIGAGGAAAGDGGGGGGCGGATAFSVYGDWLKAYGGLGGRGWDGWPSIPSDGWASGGGGSRGNGGYGAGKPSQGFAGGTSANGGGGGGGGAGEKGGNAYNVNDNGETGWGGNGGEGVTNSISGVARVYGSGGGGGVGWRTDHYKNHSPGKGGTGGGQGGLLQESQQYQGYYGQPGTDGVGGGGGGGAFYYWTWKHGGRGGEGTVIVRYSHVDVELCAAPAPWGACWPSNDYGSAHVDAQGYGVGVTTATKGETYTFYAATTWTDGLSVDAKCTGWRLLNWEDDAEIASGSGTNCTFTFPGTPVKVEWQWEATDVRYLLGGGEIDYAGPYVVHSFTESFAEVPVNRTVDVEALIVGGGGAGGSGMGGGGGGGGVISTNGVTVPIGGKCMFAAGAGGAATSGGSGGNYGSPSFFAGTGFSFMATGGGGGCGYWGYAVAPATGWASGGGGARATTTGRAANYAAQGHAGGNGTDSSGGGGGGAGSLGWGGSCWASAGDAPRQGGQGGDGWFSCITGEEVYYGGGGGGGAGQCWTWTSTDGWQWRGKNNLPGQGGAGGGGRGGYLRSEYGSQSGTAGKDGLGGGGGGGMYNGSYGNGGRGGRGVVIVRYRYGDVMVGATPHRINVTVTPDTADGSAYETAQVDERGYGMAVRKAESGKTYGFSVPDRLWKAGDAYKATLLGWTLKNRDTDAVIKTSDTSEDAGDTKTHCTFTFDGTPVYVEWNWREEKLDAFVDPFMHQGEHLFLDGTWVHVLTEGSAHSITSKWPIAAELLLVGGGGGGGSTMGGGGGGGGVLHLEDVYVDAGASNAFAYAIGGGGGGWGDNANSGWCGGNTWVTFAGGAQKIAYGGGGGGGFDENARSRETFWWGSKDPTYGGCGSAGGSTQWRTVGTSATDAWTEGQGHMGGTGTYGAGGGGGGAGEKGGNGSIYWDSPYPGAGGKGGDGLWSDITFAWHCYGSGGGGGVGWNDTQMLHVPGEGGAESGGDGGDCVRERGGVNGTSGKAGFGGGGGGAGYWGGTGGGNYSNNRKTGASGGSGTVILRYDQYEPSKTLRVRTYAEAEYGEPWPAYGMHEHFTNDAPVSLFMGAAHYPAEEGGSATNYCVGWRLWESEADAWNPVLVRASAGGSLWTTNLVDSRTYENEVTYDAKYLTTSWTEITTACAVSNVDDVCFVSATLQGNSLNPATTTNEWLYVTKSADGVLRGQIHVQDGDARYYKVCRLCLKTDENGKLYACQDVARYYLAEYGYGAVDCSVAGTAVDATVGSGGYGIKSFTLKHKNPPVAGDVVETPERVRDYSPLEGESATNCLYAYAGKYADLEWIWDRRDVLGCAIDASGLGFTNGTATVEVTGIGHAANTTGTVWLVWGSAENPYAHTNLVAEGVTAVGGKYPVALTGMLPGEAYAARLLVETEDGTKTLGDKETTFETRASRPFTPGLFGGYAGTAWNTWGNYSITPVCTNVYLHPHASCTYEYNGSVWWTYRTWKYWGYAWFEKGNVTFYCWNNDGQRLVIDDVDLMKGSADNAASHGAVTKTWEKAGWHKFELYLANTGDWGGRNRWNAWGEKDGVNYYSNYGIQENGVTTYGPNMYSRYYPIDDGTGNRYRCYDPETEGYRLEVRGSPRAVGSVYPRYGYDRCVPTGMEIAAWADPGDSGRTVKGYALYTNAVDTAAWTPWLTGDGASFTYVQTNANARIVWLWDKAGAMDVRWMDEFDELRPTSGRFQVGYDTTGADETAKEAHVYAVYGFAPDALIYTNDLGAVSGAGVTNVVFNGLLPDQKYWARVVLATTDEPAETAEDETVHAFKTPVLDESADYSTPGIRQIGLYAENNGTYPWYAGAFDEHPSADVTIGALGIHTKGISTTWKNVTGTQTYQWHWWWTWDYQGHMWFDADKTYAFSGRFWRYYGLWVNGTKAFWRNSDASSTWTWTPPKAGWYYIDVRGSNNSDNNNVGPYYNNGGCSAYGIGWNANNYTTLDDKTYSWNKFIDPGDGSLLRVFGRGEPGIELTGHGYDTNGLIDRLHLKFVYPRHFTGDLYACTGSEPAGGDVSAWEHAEKLATLTTATTTYTYTNLVQKGWGSHTNRCIRFVLTNDNDCVAWSATIFYREEGPAAVSDLKVDGSGGDYIDVTGNLDAIGASFCKVTALTGTDPEHLSVAWTNLPGSIVENTGPFSYRLYTNDMASAHFVTPDTTHYVALEIRSGGSGEAQYVMRTPVVAVTTAGAPAFRYVRDIENISNEYQVRRFWFALSKLGVGNRPTVTAWGGFTNDPDTFVQLTSYDSSSWTSEPNVLEMHPTDLAEHYNAYQTGSRGTFYIQWRAYCETADGLTNWTVRSAVKSSSYGDYTTYTWKATVKEGDWSDPDNWSPDYSIPRWLCRGYPKQGNSYAQFNTGTKAKIHVTEAADMNRMYLAYNKDLDLTFWGETNYVLSCNYWYRDNGSDKRDGTDWNNKITLDNVTFRCTHNDNDIKWWYWPSGFHWTMVNGGKLYKTNGGDNDNRRNRMHNETVNKPWKGRFDVLNGGVMQFDQHLYVGGDCLIVVSNGSFECNNNLFLNSKTSGGVVRICGTNSSVRVKYHMRNNAESGYQPSSFDGRVEFLVPVEPYARIPLQQIQNTGNDQMLGGSDAATLAQPLAIRILPESPAARVAATNDYHLVQWIRKANLKKLAFSLPSEEDEVLVCDDANAPAWTGTNDWYAANTTQPENLGVRICGSSIRGRVTISGAPFAYDFEALSPRLGDHDGYASNDVVVCEAPAETQQVSDDERATVAGWILHDVDPVTFARTPVATNTAENAARCEFTHLGGWHEVEWLWRVEYRVTATSDNAGVTASPAEQWVERGAWATVTAANSETKAWYKWTDAYGGAVSNNVTFGNHRDNPLRFCVTNAVGVQACAATRFYLKTDGSDSAAGTSWSAAVKTIRKALEKANASAPAHVTVRAGSYPMSTGNNQEFVLDKAVVFEGETNDCSAVVYRAHDGGNGDGDDYRRRRRRSVITLAHADAQIRNLGLTTRNNRWGRGVTCESGGLVDGCHVFQCITVENNGWGCHGGGAIIYGGGRIRNSTIERNSCEGTGGNGYVGGGVYMNGGMVDHCFITNNWLNPRGSGAGSGGGVFMEGTCATLRDCLIAKNCHTAAGTGLSVNGRGNLVENCVIADNYCERSGGRSGVYASCGTIRNCAIWNNTSLGTPVDVSWNAAGAWTFENCVSSQALQGSGNLVKDPQFIPGDPLYRSPYGVLTDLGATTDRMRQPDAFDLLGNARTLGAAADVGVHEMDPDAFACDFTAVVTGAGSNAVVTLDGTVTGAGECRYTWSWSGGGSSDWQSTNGVGLAHLELEGLAAGRYVIRLTVEAQVGGATTSVERQNAATVAPLVTYVANTWKDGNNKVHACGNTYPYDTWAKAAADPQDAIDAVADGGDVRVAAGAYPRINKRQMVVNRPVRVVSEEGPENTIVYGYVDHYHTWGTSQESADKFIWVGHANALVAGITFCGYNNLETMSRTERFGGLHVSGGVVSNCVIRDWYTMENPNRNSVSEHGAGVNITGGLLVDSTVCRNQIKASNNNGYVGGGIYMNGGTVDRCVVSNNWTQQTSSGFAQNGGGVYMDAGVLKNSLIVGNTCNNYGGGVFATSASKVYNCTIVGNTARYAGGLHVNSANTTVMDTIVRDNAAYEDTTVGAPDWRMATGAKVYNLWAPVFGGFCAGVEKETLALDPVFAGPAGGDYSIDASSPCVDAAARTPEAGERDLLGNPRVSGAAMDAGCCENPLDTPTFGLTYVLLDSEVGASRVRFEAHGTKALPVEPEKCCWLVDPEEGVDAVDVSWFEDDFEATNSVVTLNAGWHSVAVCVYYVDEGGVDRKIVLKRPNWFKILTSDVYVSPENLTPAQPYGSWDTAANSIEEALALVADHGTVHLAAGSYYRSTELSVTRPITIVGVGNNQGNGSVLDGTYVCRPLGVYHKDAVVSGLGIKRGIGYGRYRQVEDGFGFYLYDGVITNCWIYDNCMHHSYGATGGWGGMGGRVHNGMLLDCVVTNNWVYYNTPVGIGLYVSGTGLVDRCVIVDNKQTWNHNNNWIIHAGGLYMSAAGRVRNCIIRGNRVNGYGGVYLKNGTLDNCLVENNHAYSYNGTVYVGGCYAADPARVRNCVILNNTCAKSTDDRKINVDGDSSTYRNCMMKASGWGVDSFVSTTTGWEAETLPELTGSMSYAGQWGADEDVLQWRMDWGRRVPRKAPLLDKGAKLDWMDGDALDFNRRPRVNGKKPEIGPYECHVPQGFFYLLR